MKKNLYLTALCLCVSASLYAQGVFYGSNVSGRTRLGSLDGPLAGTNIVGQFMGGPGPSSLQPVGLLGYHYENGVFFVGYVSVPDVPPRELAYVQLLAWDSTFWGTNLAGVPSDQLGRTDIASVLLTTGTFPDVAYSPRFTQPAIVPPIPEPSAWALAVLALAALGMRRFVT
jgi:uncharacterized protein (TIGR03382 family)